MKKLSDERLIRALQELPEAPAPDPARQRAFRQAYLEQVDRILASPVSGPGFERHSKQDRVRNREIFRFGQRVLRSYKMAAIIVAIVLALTAVGGGVVYASDDSAPGDPLYGVDRAVEQLQLRLTHNHQRRLALLLAFSDERLGEAERLAEAGDTDNLEVALNEYGATISELAHSVGSAGGADREALANLLDAAFSVHEERLAAIYERAPEQARSGLERAIEASTSGRQNALQAVGRGGPPENVPVGPPENVPVGPPENVPVGPPDNVPAGPPENVPGGPPENRGGPGGAGPDSPAGAMNAEQFAAAVGGCAADLSAEDIRTLVEDIEEEGADYQQALNMFCAGRTLQYVYRHLLGRMPAEPSVGPPDNVPGGPPDNVPAGPPGGTPGDSPGQGNRP